MPAEWTWDSLLKESGCWSECVNTWESHVHFFEFCERRKVKHKINPLFIYCHLYASGNSVAGILGSACFPWLRNPKREWKGYGFSCRSIDLHSIMYLMYIPIANSFLIKIYRSLVKLRLIELLFMTEFAQRAADRSLCNWLAWKALSLWCKRSL